jgi:hypothetical protein
MGRRLPTRTGKFYLRVHVSVCLPEQFNFYLPKVSFYLPKVSFYLLVYVTVCMLEPVNFYLRVPVSVCLPEQVNFYLPEVSFYLSVLVSFYLSIRVRFNLFVQVCFYLPFKVSFVPVQARAGWSLIRCKKLAIFPSPAPSMSPARDSFVGDIPVGTGDGKICNLFTVYVQ